MSLFYKKQKRVFIIEYINSMNKTSVIVSGTTNDDKYIKLKLEQDVKSLEVLSLSISTSDVYQDFNSNYGILVGRVNGNDSVGIPNAKISVFIPLTDEDSTNSVIKGLYPYTNPRMKNIDGKRYNLLPRVGKSNPVTGIVAPMQPFGSFPIKEEVITSESFMGVYKKYYKYTAITNDSGDYMIFGVPIGQQTVHLSVDITDIGKYSMTPAAMVINLGYSPNLFYNNRTRIKESNDLNDLPNIETQEVGVDIVPFWGDTVNYEIGITRQDFKIRSILANTFTLFGSIFTDGELSSWGADEAENNRLIRELYNLRSINGDDGLFNVGIASKRNAIVTEKIYYYPSDITDDDITSGRATSRNMAVLDKNEYSSYYKNGSFAFIVNCNRRKVITDKLGNETVVDNNFNGGIYTRFRGFATFEISDRFAPLNLDDEIGHATRLRSFRYKLKVPQSAAQNNSFKQFNPDGSESSGTTAWRKQDYVFTGGTYYSVAKFHGMVYNDQDDSQGRDLNNGYLDLDKVNNGTFYYRHNVGIIQTDDSIVINPVTTGSTSGDTPLENHLYNFPSNITNGGHKYFGGNWLNFSLHFPQVGYCYTGYSNIRSMRSTTNFTPDCTAPFFFEDNDQEIAAGETNTRGFARSDLHFTSFVNIDKADLLNFVEVYNTTGGTINGFTDLDVSGLTSLSSFKNGSDDCPVNMSGVKTGGKINSDPAQSIDPRTYFFKGLGVSDCFRLLREIGII